MRGLVVVFVVVGLAAFAAVAVENYPRVMQTAFSAIEAELEHSTGSVDTTPEDPTGLTPGSGYSFVAVVQTLLQNTDGTDDLCWTVKPADSLCTVVDEPWASADNLPLERFSLLSEATQLDALKRSLAFTSCPRLHL